MATQELAHRFAEASSRPAKDAAGEAGPAEADRPADEAGAPWHAILLSSIADAFSEELVGHLLGESTARLRIERLEAVGLLSFVEESHGMSWFAYPPAVLSALRLRAGIEIDDTRRMTAAVAAAEWLADHGELRAALALLDEHEAYDALRRMLTEHWTTLAELPAAWVRGLLEAEEDCDPRLLVARVRAIADISHAEHPGHVDSAAWIQAAHILDQAAAGIAEAKTVAREGPAPPAAHRPGGRRRPRRHRDDARGHGPGRRRSWADPPSPRGRHLRAHRERCPGAAAMGSPPFRTERPRACLTNDSAVR